MLLVLGLGYAGVAVARQARASGHAVAGTARDPARLAPAVRPLAISFAGAAEAIRAASHLLVTAPPGEAGDPVLAAHRAALDAALAAGALRWVGYVSTTGVYGDHGGGLVTEETPLTPNTERGHKRLLAETQWLDLWRAHGLPVHLFRLAGIYGPGRNQLVSLMDGTAKRVIKPGQIFSRIHVEDIAATLEASMAKPHPGRAYNVCDDEACPPQDVVEFGARLLGLPVPPDVPFDAASLSPMARSFYADSKRVSNARITQELGVKLRYPTYREGLTALAATLKR